MAVAPAPSAPRTIAGKGGKFASVAPGPWVAALDRMPKPVPTALQRVKRGLADVPLNNEDHVAVEQERAARALTSILPYGSAAFILSEPQAAIAARPPSQVAEDVARTLSAYGASSLNQAYSSLGRLLAWAATRDPPITHIGGRAAADFLAAHPGSVDGSWQ